MSAIKSNNCQGSSQKKPKFSRNNFISKNEILSWINDLLKVNMTLIEQLGSGTMYCQIFDVIYPGSIALSKVKWSARLEYDFLHNFMILQSGFDKLQVPKAIPVNKLAKTRYQDNLEFAQWMKAYFDFNCKDKGKGYNALKRRGNLTPYFGFCKGGVLPKQTLFFGNAKEKFSFDETNSNSYTDDADSTNVNPQSSHQYKEDELTPANLNSRLFLSPPPTTTHSQQQSMLTSSLHFNESLSQLPPMIIPQSSPAIFSSALRQQNSKPIGSGVAAQLFGFASPQTTTTAAAVYPMEYNNQYQQQNSFYQQSENIQTPSKLMMFPYLQNSSSSSRIGQLQPQTMPSFFARQDSTNEKIQQQQHTSSSIRTPVKPLFAADESGRKYSMFDRSETNNNNNYVAPPAQEESYMSRLMLSRLQQRKEMMNSAIRNTPASSSVVNNNNNDNSMSIAGQNENNTKPGEEKKPSLTTSNLLSKIQELTNASQILLKRSSETPSRTSMAQIGGKSSIAKQLLEDCLLRRDSSFFSKTSVQKSSVKRQLFLSQDMTDNNNSDSAFRFETPLRKQLKANEIELQQQPQQQQQQQQQHQIQENSSSTQQQSQLFMKQEQPEKLAEEKKMNTFLQDQSELIEDKPDCGMILPSVYEQEEDTSTANPSETNSGNSSDAEGSNSSNSINMNATAAHNNANIVKRDLSKIENPMSANDLLVSRIKEIMSSGINSNSDFILAQIKSCIFSSN